jgi:hypothetical protein
LFFLLSVDTAFAQFELRGELRPRTEVRHGYKTLPVEGVNAAFFTEQRSRVNLGYGRDLYEIGFIVQDVRIWGSQDQLNKSDGLFSVHEAWGKINFNETVSLKAGRQELIYDDHRILGNVGWTAQGRSHDAMLFMIHEDAWALHLGLAFNQDMNTPAPARLFDTFYSGVNNYKTLQYLWYHREFNATKLSLLALNNGVQLPDSSVNFTQTIGITGSHLLSDFEIGGTAYYQTGTDPADNDLSAWLTSISISYAGLKNTGLTIGTDYLSGTGVDKVQNHSFNPLYGTHHKFYGFMDYFYVGNPHNQPAADHNISIGLVDLYLKSTVKPAAPLTFAAAIHEFYSPVSIISPADPTANLTSRLGTEIDLVFGYKLSEDLKIQAGYSHLFATSSMEIIKGGSKDQVTNWAWLMLSFNPVFVPI